MKPCGVAYRRPRLSSANSRNRAWVFSPTARAHYSRKRREDAGLLCSVYLHEHVKRAAQSFHSWDACCDFVDQGAAMHCCVVGSRR